MEVDGTLSRENDMAHSVDVELDRLRRASRRDRAALEALGHALRDLQQAALALKAENAELRAVLHRVRD
jgi:hypothetical protein